MYGNLLDILEIGCKVAYMPTNDELLKELRRIYDELGAFLQSCEEVEQPEPFTALWPVPYQVGSTVRWLLPGIGSFSTEEAAERWIELHS